MKHPVTIRTDQREVLKGVSFCSGQLADRHQVMSLNKTKANFSIEVRKIEFANFTGQFALFVEYTLFLELHQSRAAFARQMFADKFRLAFDKSRFEPLGLQRLILPLPLTLFKELLQAKNVVWICNLHHR